MLILTIRLRPLLNCRSATCPGGGFRKKPSTSLIRPAYWHGTRGSDAEHVRAAVAGLANLPPEAVACSFADICKDLGERLAQRVKDSRGLKKVSRLLKRRTAGFDRRRSGLSGASFSSPTGTGKTELAKARRGLLWLGAIYGASRYERVLG